MYQATTELVQQQFDDHNALAARGCDDVCSMVPGADLTMLVRELERWQAVNAARYALIEIEEDDEMPGVYDVLVLEKVPSIHDLARDWTWRVWPEL